VTDDTLASGDPRATPAPAVGGQIGKYEIVRPLGSGGMGVVWAARDPDLDREVAIKLLRGADASTELRTRLLREARAMARLKHPNVLTVYEVGSDGPRDFIAMELVDGVSLDLWLRDRPPAREVWDALLAAGRGLAAAHAAGLVHRDFKPHNVLRSRDGRVLVTDFGLARGSASLDDTLDAAGGAPGAGDSVLDVQLTTTGQLLGTPAYMAPEQFTGDTPDPRTDQFAFCITAWEALSGERPYRGTTIEELQRETAAGAAGKDGKLPGPVRRVLVRGLSPARAERWPDMNALLRALERARGTWRTRARVIAPAFGLAAAALVLATRPGGHTTAPDACVPGDQVFATAWSPSARADLLAKHPGATDVAALLDRSRETWLAGYAQACTRAPAQRVAAVDCYVSRRDDVAVLVEVLQRFAPDALNDLELWGVLSSDRCAGETPVASPRLPDDDRRPRAIAFLARLYGGTVTAPHGLLVDQSTWRTEAKAIGWPPLEAKLEEMIAVAAEMVHVPELAVPEYRKAADLSRSVRDHIGEAHARLGLLELGREMIGDAIPTNAYQDELRDAELAVKSAGNDAALVARLDTSRAAHAVYADRDLSAGIAIEERALATFDRLGDRRRAPLAAAMLADFLSIRGGPGDLDRAAQLVKTHQAKLNDEHITGIVRDATYWIAWLRGDVDGAHAALDGTTTTITTSGPAIHGRVVDEAGHPVAGAQVISWGGDLFGDATRAFTSPAFTYMEHAVTDDQGAFSIVAHADGGLIAELGPRRSVPVAGKPGAVLALAPTHAIHGEIDAGSDPTIGIEPFVRIDVTPQTRWFVSTAPSAEGHFTIAGIPAARDARLGATGSHWPRETRRWLLVGPATDHAVIHWPTGPAIDVTTSAPSAQVWALRGRVAPKTRAEVEELARTAPDYAMTSVQPLGWGTTSPVDLEVFRPGMHHAMIRDNAPGPTTVCIAIGDHLEVRCAVIDTTPTMAPDVRDGRRWFEAIARSLDP